MFIERISLKNFRNFEYQLIENLNPGINVFTGANGSGKTNVLEAIGLSSLAKSCRGSLDSEMVRFNSASALVEIDGVVIKKK
jgi:DNA replication and repair protein RecF